MKVKIKICGIRSTKSAKVAMRAGADFLGFNFVTTSRRYIDPKKAKKIIEFIYGKIATVGVFQNTAVAHVNEVSNYLKLDYVQLHGSEDEKYMSQVSTKIIKTLTTPRGWPNGLPRGGKIAFFLLDRKIQGRGEMVDIGGAGSIVQYYPIFLAGGLTTNNVASVIQYVKPFAVDVAGGVEDDNGRQDPEKIKRFIQIVRATNL